MHVTGWASAIGAVITGLIAADVLRNWNGANHLAITGGKVVGQESRLLAGK